MEWIEKAEKKYIIIIEGNFEKFAKVFYVQNPSELLTKPQQKSKREGKFFCETYAHKHTDQKVEKKYTVKEKEYEESDKKWETTWVGNKKQAILSEQSLRLAVS